MKRYSLKKAKIKLAEDAVEYQRTKAVEAGVAFLKAAEISEHKQEDLKSQMARLKKAEEHLRFVKVGSISK